MFTTGHVPFPVVLPFAFGNSINDVSLMAIRRVLTTDQCNILGKTNLPQRVQPVNSILM